MRRGLLITVLPLVFFLWGFTPFTTTTNICPKCPKAKADVVSLTTGLKITCNVLAQNNDYYVLEWRGELRAVMRSEVQGIEWKEEGGAAKLGTGDQILTKNNIVYHGAIVQEQQGRLFVIQVGSLKHTIWHSQIQSVHKGGTPYSLTPAVTPAPTQ